MRRIGPAQKVGPKPCMETRFAQEHGISRRRLKHMGGVAKLAAMSPEAANLMLSLMKRRKAR